MAEATTKQHKLHVIGAGLPRTGTDTLRRALNILELGPTYEVFAGGVQHPKRWYKTLKEVDRADQAGETPNVDFAELLQGFHSAVDSPASDCYIELSRVYPDSKVVLTHRDPVKWMESSRATIMRVHAFIYGVIVFWVPVCWWQRRTWLECSIPLYQRKYGGYCEAAMSLRVAEAKANIPADRLLIFKVQEGWEPLCKFLNVPIPDVPFPSGNQQEEVNAFLEEKIRTGLVRWAGVLAGLAAAVAVGISQAERLKKLL